MRPGPKFGPKKKVVKEDKNDKDRLKVGDYMQVVSEVSDVIQKEDMEMKAEMERRNAEEIAETATPRKKKMLDNFRKKRKPLINEMEVIAELQETMARARASVQDIDYTIRPDQGPTELEIGLKELEKKIQDYEGAMFIIQRRTEQQQQMQDMEHMIKEEDNTVVNERMAEFQQLLEDKTLEERSKDLAQLMSATEREEASNLKVIDSSFQFLVQWANDAPSKRTKLTALENKLITSAEEFKVVAEKATVKAKEAVLEKDRLSHEIVKLQMAVSEKQKEVSNLTHEKQGLQEKLEKIAETTSHEIENYEENFKKMRKAQMEAEVMSSKLLHELEMTNQKLKFVNGDNDKLRGISKSIEQYKQEKDDALRVAREATEALKAAQEETKKAQEETALAKKERDRGLVDAAYFHSSMEHRSQAKDKQIEELERKVFEMQEAISKQKLSAKDLLEREKTQLKTELEKATLAAQEAENMLHEERVQADLSLDAHQEELNAEIRRLKMELKVEKSENKSLQQELEDMTAKYDKISALYDDAKEQLDNRPETTTVEIQTEEIEPEEPESGEPADDEENDNKDNEALDEIIEEPKYEEEEQQQQQEPQEDEANHNTMLLKSPSHMPRSGSTSPSKFVAVKRVLHFKSVAKLTLEIVKMIKKEERSLTIANLFGVGKKTQDLSSIITNYLKLQRGWLLKERELTDLLQEREVLVAEMRETIGSLLEQIELLEIDSRVERGLRHAAATAQGQKYKEMVEELERVKNINEEYSRRTAETETRLAELSQEANLNKMELDRMIHVNRHLQNELRSKNKESTRSKFRNAAKMAKQMKSMSDLKDFFSSDNQLHKVEEEDNRDAQSPMSLPETRDLDDDSSPAPADSDLDLDTMIPLMLSRRRSAEEDPTVTVSEGTQTDPVRIDELTMEPLKRQSSTTINWIQQQQKQNERVITPSSGSRPNTAQQQQIKMERQVSVTIVTKSNIVKPPSTGISQSTSQLGGRRTSDISDSFDHQDYTSVVSEDDRISINAESIHMDRESYLSGMHRPQSSGNDDQPKEARSTSPVDTRIAQRISKIRERILKFAFISWATRIYGASGFVSGGKDDQSVASVTNANARGSRRLVMGKVKAQLESELSQAKVQIHHLTEELATAKETIYRLESELAAAKDEQLGMTRTVAAAVAKAHEMEVAAKMDQSRLEEAKMECRNLSESLRRERERYLKEKLALEAAMKEARRADMHDLMAEVHRLKQLAEKQTKSTVESQLVSSELELAKKKAMAEVRAALAQSGKEKKLLNDRVEELTNALRACEDVASLSVAVTRLLQNALTEAYTQFGLPIPQISFDGKTPKLNNSLQLLVQPSPVKPQQQQTVSTNGESTVSKRRKQPMETSSSSNNNNNRIESNKNSQQASTAQVLLPMEGNGKIDFKSIERQANGNIKGHLTVEVGEDDRKWKLSRRNNGDIVTVPLGQQRVVSVVVEDVTSPDASLWLSPKDFGRVEFEEDEEEYCMDPFGRSVWERNDVDLNLEDEIKEDQERVRVEATASFLEKMGLKQARQMMYNLSADVKNLEKTKSPPPEKLMVWSEKSDRMMPMERPTLGSQGEAKQMLARIEAEEKMQKQIEKDMQHYHESKGNFETEAASTMTALGNNNNNNGAAAASVITIPPPSPTGGLLKPPPSPPLFKPPTSKKNEGKKVFLAREQRLIRNIGKDFEDVNESSNWKKLTNLPKGSTALPTIQTSRF